MKPPSWDLDMNAASTICYRGRLMCWVKLGLNVLKDPFQFLNSMRIRTVKWSDCRSQEVSIPSGRPERSWNWNREAVSRRGTERPSPQLYPRLLFTTQERFVPAPFSERTCEAVSKIPRMYIRDFFCLFPAPPAPPDPPKETPKDGKNLQDVNYGL